MPVAKLVGVFVRLGVVGFAAAAAVGVVTGATSREPVPVDRVPAAIPSQGVNVTNVIVLLPPKDADGLISATRAVALAQQSASRHVWQHALTVPATIPGPVAVAPDAAHSTWATLRDEPAWVVTFTAARPQHVGLAPGAVSSVRHLSVILDARSGRFVRSFYAA